LKQLLVVSGVESRFERYADLMVEALGHADRATSARWYLRGLIVFTAVFDFQENPISRKAV
jgi:SRSO17 transposase